MPIYEYQCSHCNHFFDAIQKISDTPLKQCPECHQDALVKLISAAGFQLKGTGWYATDFKNAAPSKTKDTRNNADNTPSSEKANTDSAKKTDA
jgi:putative FmdB family regulatory protein